MSRIFLDLSPFYFLKQSLTEPEVHPIKQDWLVSELRGSLGLHLSSARITDNLCECSPDSTVSVVSYPKEPFSWRGYNYCLA